MINPRIFHGRHKREIDSTHAQDEEGGHVHHLTVAWVLDNGEDVVLDLKLNRDLIPDSYFEKYHKQVILTSYLWEAALVPNLHNASNIKFKLSWNYEESEARIPRIIAEFSLLKAST